MTRHEHMIEAVGVVFAEGDSFVQLKFFKHIVDSSTFDAVPNVVKLCVESVTTQLEGVAIAAWIFVGFQEQDMPTGFGHQSPEGQACQSAAHHNIIEFLQTPRFYRVIINQLRKPKNGTTLVLEILAML